MCKALTALVKEGHAQRPLEERYLRKPEYKPVKPQVRFKITSWATHYSAEDFSLSCTTVLIDKRKEAIGVIQFCDFSDNEMARPKYLQFS